MEMDIYMRRRLVALGIAVVVFILFVLLVRGCGGDDGEEADVTPLGETETIPTLSKDDYIAQADAVCAETNLAIENIDPEDEDAAQQEAELIDSERVGLESLVTDDTSGGLEKFQRTLDKLVDELEAKQLATERADTTAADAADAEIASLKAEGQKAAESYGFEECGQFGEAGTADTETDTTATETGADTATEVVPAPEPTTVEPTAVEPAPTEEPAPTTPPADSGGTAPDSGGITP